MTAGISEALDTRDKDELIREADLALIGAKRINQQAAIYSQDMHASVDTSIAEDEHHTQTLANALALAVDAKDSYTRSHCQTVAQLSVVIAMELDIDRERLVRIRLAGLLHDVGKIGVPDSILQKPARLTARRVRADEGPFGARRGDRRGRRDACRGSLGATPSRADRRHRLPRRARRRRDPARVAHHPCRRRV